MQRVTKKLKKDILQQAFLMAARQNNVSRLDQFLKEGARINYIYNAGNTAAMAAAEIGARRSFDFLLKRGADMSARNDDGRNVLHFMLLHNKTNFSARSIREAVVAGADPDAQEEGGKGTPLHLAIWKPEGYLRALIKTGARLDLLDHWGRTPLMRAAMNAQSASFDFLMAAGASHSVLDEGGINLLIWALRNRDGIWREKALKLVEMGMNPYQRDKQAMNAFDHARVTGQEDFVDVLKEAFLARESRVIHQGLGRPIRISPPLKLKDRVRHEP